MTNFSDNFQKRFENDFGATTHPAPCETVVLGQPYRPESNEELTHPGVSDEKIIASLPSGKAEGEVKRSRFTPLFLQGP